MQAVHAPSTITYKTWSLQKEMLKRFLEQQQVICAILLEDGDNRSLMPTMDEITTIEELAKISEHFYQVISGELYSAIGVVFPILNHSVTS